MQPVKTNTLKVPGATLHYEIRGSGPTLLLICGGVYDAAGYAGLAQRLADRYTVVTYDRRGNSRSPLDGPPESQSIETHADDAHRLLVEVGVTADEPAYVFGNSSGAIIGLELATRHPEQVRTLVSHEPPLFELLPDRDRWRDVIRDVEEAFAKEGTGAAMQAFATGFDRTGREHEEAATQGEQEEPTPEAAETMARMEKNMEFFIGYEVPPFVRYVPDADALRASSARVVMVAGEASEGQPPYRASFVVAEQIGGTHVMFPGDHGAFGSLHEEFAAKLDEVLSRS
ncbi:alpha/beta fold hydrolase [Streptosporangium sp. NPDC000095]|uniref:alpha/beta fold hydrolase n=1 Tax=Streptosporangium sp. NPDC000095 TaxID=3366184 RepID=UPI0036776F24